MKVIIAEKPSVAQAIASVVGARQRKEGHLMGDGYAVTWAFGHLVGLAMPESYGFSGFRREHLPILPQEFRLVPRQVREGKVYKDDPGVVGQLGVIRELFDGCESIIVATDAGREGELIFRYVYNYLGCTKPFVRLWISSLTDKAIREGLRNLREGSLYDNLYLSAKARSEADWLVGINSSQALSLAAGQGVFSLGRVQTPTLAMICSRYRENRQFESRTYFRIKVSAAKDGITFSALSQNRFDDLDSATTRLREVKDGDTLSVTSVEHREVVQEPPLLYDLTALQKEANSKLDFSADKTLTLAQSLYEKKVLSYPRTGSRYISEDVFDEIPSRIMLLQQYPRFTAAVSALRDTPLNRRPVDDAKVTDHHALLVTENPPEGLSQDEQAIYEMVAARLLEAFLPCCVKEMTEVTLSAGGEIFTLKGAVIKSAGWRAVRGEQEEEVDETTLPELQTGEILPLLASETVEKQTKPKPLHTESSLLSAMEHCGKEISDEQLRAGIREAGIGTPATRAAVIETLFARDYIRRDKKNLVPTEKGLAVYDTVKDKKIADVEMTAAWEDTLAKIETGEADAPSFRRDIEVYTAQIVAELLAATLDVAPSGEQCTCPKCKKSRILFFDKVAKCADVDCGFTLFRNKGGKVLTDKQIVGLVTTGHTPLVKSFRNREGRSFDAALVLNPDFTVGYSFPDRKPQGEKDGRKR
ncbi:type IA DNA topoisomerase [Bacteroides fragilis]|jgi:DNA topoisomerase-3|uniref:type IA DNA topoisomerase n=1 Tax=Bacteroides fragilis TaxID=817 RepID=UPI00081175DA|nr:type IA DNA topoisomerase [Bacteroides fragilis]OCJ76225.1 DNA topoisomerase III [Bacteroides fragilis]